MRARIPEGARERSDPRHSTTEREQRARARELATQARDGFQAAGSNHADKRAEVDTWLSSHIQ